VELQRCANSALNPPPTPISSLREAGLRLGPQQTHSGPQRFLVMHSLQTAFLFARMFCAQPLALALNLTVTSAAANIVDLEGAGIDGAASVSKCDGFHA